MMVRIFHALHNLNTHTRHTVASFRFDPVTYSIQEGAMPSVTLTVVMDSPAMIEKSITLIAQSVDGTATAVGKLKERSKNDYLTLFSLSFSLSLSLSLSLLSPLSLSISLSPPSSPFSPPPSLSLPLPLFLSPSLSFSLPLSHSSN